MTEDEAKTKWCPFARPLAEDAFGEPITGINRPLHEKNFCLGSQCMAWRAGVVLGYESITRKPVYDGYCGLAGKP